MDIVNIIISAIQQFAILIIILGMITAFLAKLAFFVNLIIGFILTIVIAYLVFTFTGDFGITAILFLVGVGGSFVIAAIGHILTLIEAFIIIGVGIWVLLVSGSPSDAFSITTLIATAIGSAILTGISTSIGDVMLSSMIASRKVIKKPRFQRTQSTRSVVRNSTFPQKSTLKSTPTSSQKNILKERPSPPQIIQRIFDRKKQNVRQNKMYTKKNKETSIVQKTENMIFDKRESENKLNSLDQALEEKKIDQDMYSNLKTEFQNNLDKINAELTKNLEEISEEVDSCLNDNKKLEIEKQAKMEILKELKARYLVKDITKSDYKERDKVKKNQIDEIDDKIDLNIERILELTKVLKKAE